MPLSVRGAAGGRRHGAARCVVLSRFVFGNGGLQPLRDRLILADHGAVPRVRRRPGVAEAVHHGPRRSVAGCREGCVRVAEIVETDALGAGGSARRKPHSLAEVLSSERRAFGHDEHESVNTGFTPAGEVTDHRVADELGSATVRVPALVFGGPHTKWPLTSVHCSTDAHGLARRVEGAASHGELAPAEA